VASNAVGAIVDSALFLWLAFGSLEFFAGQFVGKTVMTLPALALLAGWRAWNAEARPA
jgi:queuosine precursor transporter